MDDRSSESSNSSRRSQLFFRSVMKRSLGMVGYVPLPLGGARVLFPSVWGARGGAQLAVIQKKKYCAGALLFPSSGGAAASYHTKQKIFLLARSCSPPSGEGRS